MARFFGGVQGQAGEATRLGSLRSGMRGFVRGWNVGVTVYADQDARDGFEHGDAFTIYANGGSHDASDRLLLGTVRLGTDGRPEFIPSDSTIATAERTLILGRAA